MGISAKRRRFCAEYIKDLNGTQAAIRSGYSERTANREASRLLTNVDIQNEISRLQEARAKRTQVDQDRVLAELARVGFSDPRRLFDEQGRFLPIQDWPTEMAAAVMGLDFDEKTGELKKVRFWPKVSALDLLARHLGMLKDREIQEEPRKIAADIRVALKEIDEKTAPDHADSPME